MSDSEASTNSAKQPSKSKERASSKTTSRANKAKRVTATKTSSSEPTLNGDAVLKPRAIAKPTKSSKKKRDVKTTQKPASPPSDAMETTPQSDASDASAQEQPQRLLLACEADAAYDMSIGQRIVLAATKHTKRGGAVRERLVAELDSSRVCLAVSDSKQTGIRVLLDEKAGVAMPADVPKRDWTVVQNVIKRPYHFFSDVPFVITSATYSFDQDARSPVNSASLEHVVQFLRKQNNDPRESDTARCNMDDLRISDRVCMWNCNDSIMQKRNSSVEGTRCIRFDDVCVDGHVYIADVNNMAISRQDTASANPGSDKRRFLPFLLPLKYLVHQSIHDTSTENALKPSVVAMIRQLTFTALESGEEKMQASVPCLAPPQLFRCEMYDSDTQAQQLVCYVYALCPQMALHVVKSALQHQSRIQLTDKCDVLILPVDNTDCLSGFLFALTPLQPILTEDKTRLAQWPDEFRVEECIRSRSARNAGTCYDFLIADKRSTQVWFHGVALSTAE